MSNFIKKVEHPETGEWVEAEFLDDYFGKHNYGLRLPDGRVFGKGCLTICKTEEGEDEELLTGYIQLTVKKVEPKESELSLKGKIVKMVAEQLNNVCNLQKVEPLINDIENLLIRQKKECKHVWESNMCVEHCVKCGFVEPKETLEGWEQEYCKKFGLCRDGEKCQCKDELKFISNLLISQKAQWEKRMEYRKNEARDLIKQSRSQLIKEIEGMKLTVYRNPEQNYVNYTASEYNKAIDDIITLLKT